MLKRACPQGLRDSQPCGPMALVLATRRTFLFQCGGRVHDQRQWRRTAPAGAYRRPGCAAATPAQRRRPVHQGLLIREPECPALAWPQPEPADHRHPDQCRGGPTGRERFRGSAQDRGQGGSAEHGSVCFRPDICRRLPFAECPAAGVVPGADDRMPAAAVPVRTRDHRQRCALRRLPATAARSGRFRCAVSAAHGGGAGAAPAAPTTA